MVHMTATNAAPVGPANIEQLRNLGWRRGRVLGRERRLVRPGGRRVPRAAARRPPIGERDHMLDVGCGTGQTARDAARRVSGSGLGTDLSSRMVDYARRRATVEGVTDVRFAHADAAQINAFAPGAHDVAISRTPGQTELLRPCSDPCTNQSSPTPGTGDGRRGSPSPPQPLPPNELAR